MQLRNGKTISINTYERVVPNETEPNETEPNVVINRLYILVKDLYKETVLNSKIEILTELYNMIEKYDIITHHPRFHKFMEIVPKKSKEFHTVLSSHLETKHNITETEIKNTKKLLSILRKYF